EAQADVGLEDLAGDDAAPAFTDGSEMTSLVAVTEVKLAGSGVARPVAARTKQADTQVVQAAGDTLRRAGADQGLEPPLPGWVEVQNVVVVRQMVLGQDNRAWRTDWQILDAATEPVTEPSEPAAADRRSAGRMLG